MKKMFFATGWLLSTFLIPAGAAERPPLDSPVVAVTASPRLLAQNNADKAATKKSAPARNTELKYLDPSEATGSSAAVIVGQNHLAHTSQLLALDADGQIIGKKDAPLQIERVLDNLQTALTAVGSDFNRLVKINVVVTQQKTVAEVQKAFPPRFRTISEAL